MKAWPTIFLALAIFAGAGFLSGCAFGGAHPDSGGTPTKPTPASEWQSVLHNAGFWIIIATTAACIGAAYTGKLANAPSIAIAGGVSLGVCVITSLSIPYIQTGLFIASIVALAAGAFFIFRKLYHGGGISIESIKVAMFKDITAAKALGASLESSKSE